MKKSLITLICAIFLLWWFSLAWNYTSEQENAYNYALNQKITTVDSIEKAKMNGELTRIAMAKMISNFAINVLWLQPDTSIDCSFSDVSDSLDSQYNYWATQACQLWLMWIWNDWKKTEKFDPNTSVTRAQFGTAFSRALSKAKWKVIENGNPYYSTHLEYLQSEWIIKSVSEPSPSTVEKRWNVMIMMMRASEKNNSIEIEFIWNSDDEDQFQKISAENLAKLKDKWVIRWPENAKITIVEFTELLCPYCQRQSQQWTITSAMQQFSGQVNSISRSFIIHGDSALQLHSAIECVASMNPWVYYDVLDEAFWAYPVDMTGVVDIAVKNWVNKKSLQECIDEWRYIQSIIDVMNIWSELWVNWTPWSIIIDNDSLRYDTVMWAYPVETFVETIESLLN